VTGADDSASGTEGVAAGAGAGVGAAGMTVASDPGNLTFTESSGESSKESAVGCVATVSLGVDSTTEAGADGFC
jgi:hypothetical protein